MDAAHSPQHKTETESFDLLNEKEHLSMEERVKRFPYPPQTIRNLMSHGVLREGFHYFKPIQRQVLFNWSAIRW
jgi:hypothetical protein